MTSSQNTLRKLQRVIRHLTNADELIQSLPLADRDRLDAQLTTSTSAPLAVYRIMLSRIVTAISALMSSPRDH